ncbi:MAG: nitrous oxide reductase accessory protein NosL [Acidobacteriota bacterium]
MTRTTRRAIGILLALGAVVGACRSGPPQPAELDTRHDACASCRMAVSDRRFAAQIVAPNELPLFFDDIGCLRDYLAEHPQLRPGSIAFVADHRTGEWVAAARAAYSRVVSLETPMGSHLIAHASPESRAEDPVTVTGQPLTAADVFGAAGPPAGAAEDQR